MIRVQKIREVDGEVCPSEDQPRKIAQRVILDQQGDRHEQRAHRKQGQYFDEQGQAEVFTHRDDVRTVDVHLKDLREVGERGIPAAFQSENDPRGSAEQQDGSGRDQQQGYVFGDDQSQPSLFRGAENGKGAVLFLIQQQSRDEDEDKQQHTDIAVGIGEIHIPALAILKADGQILVHGIHVDHVALIAVFVAVLAHAIGQVFLLKQLGVVDHLVKQGGVFLCDISADTVEIPIGVEIEVHHRPNFFVVLGPDILYGVVALLAPHHGLHVLLGHKRAFFNRDQIVRPTA